MEVLFIEGWMSGSLVKALTWTFIHSLWIGLLAAAFAGLIIMRTRKTSAQLRYNLLGLVFFLFVVGVIAGFLLELNSSAAEDNSKRVIASVTVTVQDANLLPVDIADQSLFEKLTVFINANAGIILFAWSIIFLFHLLKLFLGFAGVHRMRTYKTQMVTQTWQSRLEQMARELSIRTKVTLLESGVVKLPLTLGYFKPVILVPFGLLSNLPPEQVETVLLHELAHIRRNDYIVNIFQRIAESVFFFNPGLVWISSLIRQEREACCDDMVVMHSRNKGCYVEALVVFQEYALGKSQYAMAIGSRKQFLFNRVKRILTRENKKLNLMEKILLTTGLISLMAFTIIPSGTQMEAIKTERKSMQSARVVLPKNESGYVLRTRENPEVKKAALKIVHPVKPVETILDTVPKVKREKMEPSEAERNFPQISSNSNNDGTNKTETVTATDKSGKTYHYTRLNGKVTSMTVDGKAVPENEYAKYDDIIQQVEKAREESRERKLVALQKRREEMEVRREEMHKRREELTQQRQAQRDRISQERQDRAMKVREKAMREDDEVSQKIREEKMRIKNEKQETKNKEIKEKNKELKEKQKDLKEKQEKDAKEAKSKPRKVYSRQFIDGREVIKVQPNKNINQAYNYDLSVNSNFNYEAFAFKNVQYNVNASKNLNSDVKFDMDFKFHPEIKKNINKQINLNHNLDLKFEFKLEKEPGKSCAPTEPVTYSTSFKTGQVAG